MGTAILPFRTEKIFRPCGISRLPCLFPGGASVGHQLPQVWWRQYYRTVNIVLLGTNGDFSVDSGGKLTAGGRQTGRGIDGGPPYPAPASGGRGGGAAAPGEGGAACRPVQRHP